MSDQSSSERLASDLPPAVVTEQAADFFARIEHVAPTKEQLEAFKRWQERATKLAATTEISELAEPFRTATSPADVAAVLATALRLEVLEHPKHLAKPVTAKLLNYYAFHKKATRYRNFQIPKRTRGEMRDIKAPDRGLLRIQRLLLLCLTAAFTTYDDAAHGFVPGRSVLTNAQPHAGRRFVLNVDLKDFFTNTHYGRVESILKLAPFHLSLPIARLVANLCCDQGCLPQGAPTSPLLTNAVCQRLDRRLRQLATRYRAVYTRYADDITFSSQRPAFREKFYAELKQVLESEGYQENAAKRRLQLPNVRQEVTGIVVNEQPNVPREYVRQIRAMLHNWETKGYETASATLRAHYRDSKAGARHNGTVPKLERVLAGKIAYLGMVRGRDDKNYLDCRNKLSTLSSKKETSQLALLLKTIKEKGFQAASELDLV